MKSSRQSRIARAQGAARCFVLFLLVQIFLAGCNGCCSWPGTDAGDCTPAETFQSSTNPVVSFAIAQGEWVTLEWSCDRFAGDRKCSTSKDTMYLIEHLKIGLDTFRLMMSPLGQSVISQDSGYYVFNWVDSSRNAAILYEINVFKNSVISKGVLNDTLIKSALTNNYNYFSFSGDTLCSVDHFFLSQSCYCFTDANGFFITQKMINASLQFGGESLLIKEYSLLNNDSASIYVDYNDDVNIKELFKCKNKIYYYSYNTKRNIVISHRTIGLDCDHVALCDTGLCPKGDSI